MELYPKEPCQTVVFLGALKPGISFHGFCICSVVLLAAHGLSSLVVARVPLPLLVVLLAVVSCHLQGNVIVVSRLLLQ